MVYDTQTVYISSAVLYKITLKSENFCSVFGAEASGLHLQCTVSRIVKLVMFLRHRFVVKS